MTTKIHSPLSASDMFDLCSSRAPGMDATPDEADAAPNLTLSGNQDKTEACYSNKHHNFSSPD